MTDSSAHVVSWRIRTPHCGAFVSSGTAGSPRQCEGLVTHAGLTLNRHRVEAWLAFACRAHSPHLIAARELLDRDRAVLDDWREREADALAGRGWRKPEPLVVGAEAWALVRRADPKAGC